MHILENVASNNQKLPHRQITDKKTFDNLCAVEVQLSATIKKNFEELGV